MHYSQLPRSVGRWAPLAAAILGSAVFAGPAAAQAPPAAPGPGFIGIGANTSEVLAEGLSPATVTVERNGNVLTTGDFVDSTDGAFSVNSAEFAAAGLPTGCWADFTPQILPGDVVTVEGEDPVTIPDLSVEQPVLEGDTVVVHGTAKGVPAGWDLGAQIFPAAGGKFAGGVGSSGGAFLDSIGPRGFAVTFSFDPGSTTHWTARFSGLGAQTALASGGDAVVEAATPDVVGAGTLFGVDFAANPVPAGQAGCPAYAPDEARTVSRSLINVANAGTDLTVTGVSHPGASLTGISLIDSTGKIVTASALGGTAWSATVPAASFASLADGPISIAPTLATFGNGATATGLLTKDTTAPAAVTASVAAGTYETAQNVALNAAEGTIYYTTDGSDPSAASTKYTKAINVAGSQSIKAVALDKNGNPSQIASFDYTIAPKAAPAAPVAAPALPKLRIESLTLNRHLRLRGARRSGISSVVYAPNGAKIAKIRILRGKKVIQTLTRKIGRDGVLEVRLPSSKKARRALRRGVYTVQFQVGQDLAHLGSVLTRTVRIQ